MSTYDPIKEIEIGLGEFLISSNLEEISHSHLFGSGAVAELEGKLAGFYNSKHALLVASGSAGLLAVGSAIGIKNADFIAPPLVYGGSLSGWLMLGGRPVFTDIDRQTLTLDPVKVGENITGSTKAILGVDTFGNPSDSNAIRRIADEAGLWYISDSCQSFGAFRNGGPAGHLADAIVISFTSTKPIAAGEGGAIITNNTDLYHRLLWISQHPLRQKRELGLGIYNEFGVGMRIHPLAAIWANTLFDRALDQVRSRQRFCLDVVGFLTESELTEPVDLLDEAIIPSFFSFTVEPKSGISTGSIVRYLNERGIGSTAGGIPATVVYKNPVFCDEFDDQYLVPEMCVVAEQAEKRISLSFAKKTTGDDL